MTGESETHPMTRFLHEVEEGRVAFSPSTEKDTGLHWIFNRENGGFDFTFVVHDRDGVLGREIYARNLRWIGHFVHRVKFEYVDEPSEEIRELVSESVKIREEPLDIGKMELSCPGCRTVYWEYVMPKMDLVINGSPAQRIFVETCPECGEDLIDKKTYGPGSDREYPEDASELDTGKLWEHSRRTP